MPVPLILDTDIGTDVDDCLALALLLASPEFDLCAVTTVYGDVLLRSRMVRKLLTLRGVADLPIAAGADKPLEDRGPVYWEGHEGQGLLTPDDLAWHPGPEHAAELIVRLARADPGQLHLAAIGPLTNVALALVRDPQLARNLAGVTLMGGAVGGAGALHLPWVEHNFGCDPEAAKLVLASGAELRIVPLDVTTLVRIEPVDVARIRSLGDPFHLVVADQVERYPKYQKRGYTFLHDPLAVATLIRPDLVEWTPVYAQVETGGEYSAGKLVASAPTQSRAANAQVALRVDVPAAQQFIIERLLA
jgi:purine nucleosidase